MTPASIVRRLPPMHSLDWLRRYNHKSHNSHSHQKSYWPLSWVAGLLIAASAGAQTPAPSAPAAPVAAPAPTASPEVAPVPGLKVLGKIELDSKGRVVRPKPAAPAAVAPVAAAIPAAPAASKDAAPAPAAPAAQTTLNPQAAWPFPTANKPYSGF